jgi:hypothetical protein
LARAASLHFSHHASLRIVWVYEQSDRSGVRNQLGHKFEPLGRQLAAEPANAGDVAARPGEIGDKAGRDRVAPDGEDDRDRLTCRFRRAWRTTARRHDHVDLATDEIGG